MSPKIYYILAALQYAPQPLMMEKRSLFIASKKHIDYIPNNQTVQNKCPYNIYITACQID